MRFLFDSLRWMRKCGDQKTGLRWEIFFLWSLFIFPGPILLGQETSEQFISTRLGTYSVKRSPPTLSNLKTIPLFADIASRFPNRPSWHETANPPGFIFFANAEDLYQSALDRYNKRELRNSLDEFDETIQKFPGSQFYQASLFWKSQIYILLKQYEDAQKILLQIIEDGKHSEYLLRSAHIQIWLTLFRGDARQAIDYANQYTQTILTPEILEEILPLQIFAYLKENQHVEALNSLLKLQEQFPQNSQYFENTVQIAQLYHRLQQWDLVDPLIQSVHSRFRNHHQMEHLLLIGLSSDLQRKNWQAAQQKLSWMEENVIQKRDLFAQGFFYFNLWQNNPEQAGLGLDQFSTNQLKSENLRFLFHYAFDKQWFTFLTNFDYDESLISNWGLHAHWILGYAHDQLKVHEEAHLEYQKALSYVKQPVWKEKLSFYLASLELQTNNFEKASNRLNRMLIDYQQSPKKSEYVFWYGIVQGEFGSSMVPLILKQVNPTHERLDDSFFYLQRFYHDEQNWERTRFYFKKLISSFPQTPFLLDAYYYHADALFAIQQYEDAKQVLEDWRKTQPHEEMPTSMRELWVRVLMELRLFSEANLLLEQIEASALSFEMIQLKIRSLMELERFEALVETITHVLERTWNAEQLGYLYFTRAESAYVLPHSEQTIQFYRQALEYNLHGDVRFLYHKLAKLTYVSGHYVEFLELSEKVLQGPPDQMSVNVLILLIEYYFQSGNKNREQQYLQTLAMNYELQLSRGPFSPSARAEILFELAIVKKRLDLYQEAHQLLDQILALDDSNIPSFDVLKEKGDIALLAKQFNQAAALFLKVIYLDANAQPVEKFNLLRKIAFSYEQVKKFKQAESVYQKMLQEFEDQDLQKQARDHLERLKLVPRETQE